MKPLNLPPCKLNLKEVEGKIYFFDPIRKKDIVMTPEEWVRQHFVQFLINQYSYPKSLIKLESGHQFNNLSKRSDILIYDRYGKIFMLVECKSYDVSITQKTFEQAGIYNLTYKSEYLVVTNGLQHFICKMNFENNSFQYLSDFPEMPL